MLKIVFSLWIFLGLFPCIFAQEDTSGKNLVGGVSIADDTIPPHPSAILDVRSVSKGVLIPQMSSAEMVKIDDPANGLMVFVTDTTQKAGIWFNNNGSWQQLKFRKAYYPLGSIIMYSSTVTGYFDSEGKGIHSSTLGWHICNGNNGTPDLRDRFVVGYDPNSEDYNGYGANTNDARNEYTLGYDSLPKHKHEISSVTVSQKFNHTHKLVNEKGKTDYVHTHEFSYINTPKGRPGHDLQRRIKAKKSKERLFQESGLGLETEDNSRDISGSITLKFGESGSENPEPIDNRPAYYTLIYIMRTSPSYPAFKDIVNP